MSSTSSVLSEINAMAKISVVFPPHEHCICHTFLARVRGKNDTFHSTKVNYSRTRIPVKKRLQSEYYYLQRA